MNTHNVKVNSKHGIKHSPCSTDAHTFYMQYGTVQNSTCQYMDMLYSVLFCHIYSVCAYHSLKFVCVKIPNVSVCVCVFVCVIRFKCARHKSPEQFQGNRKQYCSVQQLHARINYFGIVSAIFFNASSRFVLKTIFFATNPNIRIFEYQAPAGTEYSKRNDFEHTNLLL